VRKVLQRHSLPGADMKPKPFANSPARAVAWKSTDIEAYLRGILKAAGEDPSVVPTEPFHLQRLPKVIAKVALGERTIYRRIAAGQFPKPIAIDGAAAARAA
jgi:predicted DNA-binding transcriptional regulator AlpA